MEGKEIKVSSYRYINLVLFIFAGFCNSVGTQAFSAIGPITRDLYQVSQLQVNIVSMMNSILYPFVLFPTNYIIETYGIKIGTLTGQMFICLGLIVRLLINDGFYFFIVGTFITGLGFCFLLNSPNKFVVNWFPVEQISIMNSICLFAIFMSDSLGTFSSAIFLDKESGKQDYFVFFSLQSLIIICILLLMAIFFRGVPKNPPNYASQVHRAKYLPSLKSLLFNKNYLILFSSMTFIYGAINIFFVCLSWILTVYDFSALQTGILFIVANISGLVGCVVTGLIFSSQAYRRNCIIYIYGCIVSLGVMMVGMEVHLAWVLYVGAGGFGFGIFPYLSTMTDFASETAFPVGEAISSGTLLFGGQVFGVISSLLMSLFIFDGESMVKTHYGEAIIFVIMFLGVICLHLSKSILRRSAYEQDKKDGKKSESLLTESIEIR